MSQKRVLDSFGLLSYLKGEAGSEKVRDAFRVAQEAGEALLMNEINVGETYYILFKNRGREKAEYFLETILPGLPIRTVDADFDLVIASARIKAEYPLSFADCFVVALAAREGASVITGDPEFQSVASLVKVDWLDR